MNKRHLSKAQKRAKRLRAKIRRKDAAVMTEYNSLAAQKLRHASLKRQDRIRRELRQKRRVDAKHQRTLLERAKALIGGEAGGA